MFVFVFRLKARLLFRNGTCPSSTSCAPCWKRNFLLKTTLPALSSVLEFLSDRRRPTGMLRKGRRREPEVFTNGDNIMFFTVGKIGKRLKEIKASIYRERCDVSQLIVCDLAICI